MDLADLIDRLHAYDAEPHEGMGGNLHIITEDGNVEDHHVRFCLDEALADGDEDGATLARAILALSKPERRRLCDEWFDAQCGAHQYPNTVVSPSRPDAPSPRIQKV